uniref:Cilia- and flagella-associated protein 157 n=1 Tax=Fundulus heteroclitus TaxID=8078 RepID=A0A3Q2TSW9_FUNHE
MGDKTGSEHQEMSLFLVQIRYLEEELDRYRLTYEELVRHNKELLSHYNKLEKEKRDKTEPLKRIVAAKEKVMDELREQLETQHLSAKRERISVKQEHDQRKQELQELINQLQSKVTAQAAILEENENEITELQRQVTEARNEEERLSKKKEEYEANIQRLKKNSELNCDKLIHDFQDYHELTESAKASQRLAKCRAWRREQSEVVSFLLEEQSTLTEEIGALRRRQDQLRSDGRGLMRKITCLSRLKNKSDKDVKLLWKKFQELKEDKENLANEQEVSLANTDALRRRLSRTSEECRQKVADIDWLEEELERETIRRRNLEGVKEEAVIILRHILTSPGDMPEWKIWRLVEILDRAAPQGTGPTSNSSRKKARGGQNLYTSNPNSPRNENDLPDPAPLQSDSWTGTGSIGP